MTDQPTPRDQLIEQAARIAGLIDWNPTCLPGQHEMTIVRQVLESAGSLGLLADPELALDLENAKGTLAAVRWKLGTPEGRAVSMHAGEIRAERDALQAKVDDLKRSYMLKVQDFAKETARVSAGLRACTVTPTNEYVPQVVVGEALLGWRDAQKHIGDAIRNGALRAALQGEQPAEPEPRCMNGPAKQHTLHMVGIIKALKAAAALDHLPLEPPRRDNFVRLARAIVDHWPRDVDKAAAPFDLLETEEL